MTQVKWCRVTADVRGVCDFITLKLDFIQKIKQDLLSQS
jgi:hypothetical protein